MKNDELLHSSNTTLFRDGPTSIYASSGVDVSDFTYICNNVYEDKTAVQDEPIMGCTCMSCCELSASKPTCECLTRIPLGSCYTDTHRLSEDFLMMADSSSGYPVFECGDCCTCAQTCPNRVVQRGIQIPLEIFEAGKKGRGVRTLKPISRGTFVCCYVGKVSLHEATLKTDAPSMQPLAESSQVDPPTSSQYPFVLRETFGSKTHVTVIDAKEVGNVARFINHSCEPNLVPVVVRVGWHAVPRIAFFAVREIEELEELTYAQVNDPLQANVVPCHCGAASCERFMPFSYHNDALKQ